MQMCLSGKFTYTGTTTYRGHPVTLPGVIDAIFVFVSLSDGRSKLSDAMRRASWSYWDSEATFFS